MRRKYLLGFGGFQPQQLMSDPMLNAAKQFGGQFAEQQKEKVSFASFPSKFQLFYFLAHKISWNVQFEVLLCRRQRLCWQETRHTLLSVFPPWLVSQICGFRRSGACSRWRQRPGSLHSAHGVPDIRPSFWLCSRNSRKVFSGNPGNSDVECVDLGDSGEHRDLHLQIHSQHLPGTFRMAFAGLQHIQIHTVSIYLKKMTQRLRTS